MPNLVVEVGRVYRHFRGKDYIVTDITDGIVKYNAVGGSTHYYRGVDNFFEDISEYKKESNTTKQTNRFEPVIDPSKGDTCCEDFRMFINSAKGLILSDNDPSDISLTDEGVYTFSVYDRYYDSVSLPFNYCSFCGHKFIK